MSTQLNPYLNFRGNAREAAEFYQSVFGGELHINTFKEFGGAQSPDEENLVMHSQLETPDGFTLMAADVPTRMEYKPGNNFSMSLSGENEGQLRGWYDKLADGGMVTMPMEKATWGDIFGMCVDRFGVSWLVNVNAAAPVG
ncbi:MAG: VOC family protein [Candidatus Dormibacteria bacterium]